MVMLTSYNSEATQQLLTGIWNLLTIEAKEKLYLCFNKQLEL